VLANIKIDSRRFIMIEIALMTAGYLVVLGFYGVIYANSFLLGALTMFLANFMFFFRLFINKQFSPGVEIIIFYFSELLKLSVVAVATIIFAIYIKPKLFSYIFGLVLLQLVVCFVPILLKKSK